jgi:hypothetical protein
MSSKLMYHLYGKQTAKLGYFKILILVYTFLPVCIEHYLQEQNFRMTVLFVFSNALVHSTSLDSSSKVPSTQHIQPSTHESGRHC